MKDALEILIGSESSDTEMLLTRDSTGAAGANKPVPLRILRKPVPMRSPSQEMYQDEPSHPPLGLRRKAVASNTSQYGIVAESSEGKSRRAYPGWVGVLRVWGWEAAALAVSGVALIAIVIMLSRFEGAKVRLWKAPFSINATVAILSTIFRGLLFIPISNGLGQLKWLSLSKTSERLANADIYDQASRGVWGSVVLLARHFTKRRVSLIASIGSILGLLALITEPFSQAAVSIGLCHRSFPRQAAMPRSNGYNAALHVGAGMSELSSKMQFAVLSGFYNPPRNTSQAISDDVTCPTGNCTFMANDGGIYFNTLDMCHSCKDVSEKIKRDEETHYNYLTGYPDNITLSIKDHGFPRGSVFGFIHSDMFFREAVTEPWPDGLWDSTSFFSFQGMADVLDKDLYNPLAFDCSLRPCARSLYAKVTNSQYTEEEHDRQYLHWVAAGQNFQLTMNMTKLNGTSHNCTSTKNRTATHAVQVTPPELQWDEDSRHSGLWYEPACYFSISLGVGLGFHGYLESFFKREQVIVQPGAVVQGDAWAKDLWNRGNMTMAAVDKFAAGLAVSIGAEMRRNGIIYIPDDTLPYPVDEQLNEAWDVLSGDMTLTESCITVQWKYLSFLAMMWTCTVFFTVTIVVAQQRSELGQGTDWKTSTLPLLFQAVLGGDGLPSTTSCRESDLRRRAEDVFVNLAESNGRWILQQHAHESD